MSTVNSLGQNQWQPGARSDAFIPDQLIASHSPLPVTDDITIAAGHEYKRGTILGRQSLKSVAAVAASGNTGNGTLAVSLGTAAEVGAYTLTATSATSFTLKDPTGTAVGTVTAGTAFDSNQLDLTVTAGATAFVAGDVFTITVSAAAGTYVLSVRTATDGSQYPSAVLIDDVDSTAGAVNAGGYFQVAVNVNRITYDDSWTVDDLKAELRGKGIFLKDSLSATPV
ncbi:head decoration protein [Pantoea stewartii]|uniref:Head decoration protein n=1 Tax=Pantoea stewartii subsp. stewartii DC283 TaxID=660596 RepID=H3RLM4_PANSE|nr:head decoration protein [Pantoea stewartii]ARF52779.1 hypothetical protein DSJ_26600 [Pantoea stewartii subsp. stewartii DC283]EHT97737.1 hypothetical protein CKS_5599 [Pantoea stewartii subsp. stewartii DC283]KAB0553987.1 hypothetical protein F7Q90_12400 [Pantoea stewartii subsp. stewartii]